MGAQETEPQQPINSTQDLETARAAKALLEEVESVLDAAQRKLADFNAASATLAELSASAIAAKTQLTDTQAVIATKSEHIQGAQEHADKVRAELDRVQTAATQNATETEGLRGRAQSASDSIAEILTVIRGHKTATEADLAATAAARDQAKTASAAAKALADKSETIEKRIAVYEERLAELEAQCNAQLKTITDLLPGATAAGLAHAFDDRRKTFLDPGKGWQRLFVGSVIALVILASSGLWNVYITHSQLTWDELARLWVARLPIAAALIWLALHASRESALAKRLEEDYGFKAATAASFQGFQKQMADIGAAAPAESPLSKLCADTLATIASPPGRIYDKHQLVVSPSTEVVAIASAARDAAVAKVK